jgi:hypothetical protein
LNELKFTNRLKGTIWIKELKKKMYYILFFLPLMSATIQGLGGRYVGEKGAARITTSLIILTSLLSWFAFYEVGLNGCPTYVPM